MSNLDWTKPLVTNSGKLGFLQPEAPHENRRRVAIGHDGKPLHDNSVITIWLYSENGVCRCDGQPGPYDLVNAA